MFAGELGRTTIMLAIPLQGPAIVRSLTAGLGAEDGTRQEVAALCSADGVLASQSRCTGLTGPARSLCYAALYGAYV
jgi:hypothetical protein